MPVKVLLPIFEQAAAERVFPGGVVWLGQGAEVVAHRAFGTTAYDDPISRPVELDTIYDVASITKLFTATAFFIAARQSDLDYDTPLYRFMDEFKADGLERITLRQLLNHSHGLNLHIQELVEFPVTEWNARIAAGGLMTQPGESVRYMCTAYYLLGQVIEAIADSPLETFIMSRIIEPLGMARSGYKPLRRLSVDEIAPTERDEATGEAFRGVVHDEAARAVETTGGISGNSGLFSTAADLSRFARLWLQRGAWEGRQIIDERDVERALTDFVQAEGYKQGLGLHIDVSVWMSPRAPAGSAGHAGFTGPSLFISPATGHSVIILNNRVYPTRQGPMRLGFHRQIAEWLFAATSA